MKKNHWNKLKRIFWKALPTSADFSLFFKGLVLVFIVMTGGIMFNYISTANAQTTETKEEALSGVLTNLGVWTPAGCGGVFGFGTNPNVNFSSASSSGGFGRDKQESCAATQAALAPQSSTTTEGSANSRIVEIDYGATGRLLSSGSAVYDANIAQPGTTMVYYADNIRGTAHAADNPTSGRSFLAPIFFLNQAMVNLAYGLVVIVLLVSALNILLTSLTGGEERFTLVQLLINAGVTLIVITFYYEISAVIYDLTVNYGNALVASILSPYLNAQVILERVQPGGDLNVVMLLNTFEFTGIADSLLVVSQTVASGLYPAIAQSTGTLANIFGPIIGTGQVASGSLFAGIANWLGFAGGVSSLGISYIASTFLGSKEVYDSVIAWAVFFINLKIFFNLLTTAITYSVYTSFGPLIALGGTEKITDSFKTLGALGLVFPGTFGGIMLAATVLNMFIRKDVNAPETNTGSLLCKYSPGDPTSTAEGIINRDWVSDQGQKFTGGDITREDPKEFRIKNYINQKIYDVTPASSIGGVRDCRSALFPTPFTFIPAPFGTMGNRGMQIQLIDSLVRTCLAIIFLLMASRMPAIINEALGIKEFGPVKGIGKAFSKGAQSFFSVGGTALSLGLPLASGLMNGAQGLITRTTFRRDRRIGGFLGGVSDRINRGRLRGEVGGIFGTGIGARLEPNDPAAYAADPSGYKGGFKPIDTSSLGDVTGKLRSRSKEFGAAQMQGAYSGSYKGFSGMTDEAGNPISQSNAQLLAGQSVLANYDKLNKQMTTLGNAMQGMTGIVDNLTKTMGGLANEISKLLILDLD